MSDNSAVGKSPKDEDARSIVSSTRSIASHRSLRSSSTASTLSLLSASSRTPGSSLATSNVSLRELESKKLEIERELRRVQQELEERQKESFKILK